MQDAARQADHPSAEVFRRFKSDGRPIPPERVAQFLAWLLAETNDEEFTRGDWNTFDESHHPTG